MHSVSDASEDPEERVLPIAYTSAPAPPSTSKSHRGRALWIKGAKTVKKNKINYQELDDTETRLVCLQRCAHVDDLIDIKIREKVSFNDLGDYEALSYHWGEGYSEEPVFLREDNDGLSDQLSPPSNLPAADVEPDRSRRYLKLQKMANQRYYMPKQNLYHALAKLRKRGRDVTMWIDALCINQDDAQDKTRQVQRMSEIYSRARRVIIWLGDSDERKLEAMEFVRKLINNPQMIAEYVRDDKMTKSWRNLLYLMRSSWFSRRWIIQELALARDAVVFCGSCQIHWRDLQDAISIFTDNFDNIRQQFRGDASEDYHALGEIEPLHAKKLVDNITRIFRRHPQSTIRPLEPLLGLEFLVSSLAILDAADPRDTINAFRNIAKETYLKQDKGPQHHGYESNLLLVYISFVKWVVKETNCLDIICRRWAIPEKTESEKDINYPDLVALPSWIQVVEADDRSNTVRGQRRHGDTFVSLPGERGYKASSDLKAVVSFGIDRPPTLPGQSSLATPRVVVSAPISHEDAQILNTEDDAALGASLPEIEQRAQGIEAQQDHTMIASSTSTDHISAQPGDNPLGSSEIHRSASRSSNASKRRDRSSSGGPSGKRPQTIDINRSLGLRLGLPRRVSVSESNSSSPTLLHHPRAYEKAIIRQLQEKKLDASLYVKGIQIGQIERVASMHEGVIGREIMCELYGTANIQPGAEVPDEVWRTLVAERGPDGTVPPALYARACQYAMLSLTRNSALNIKALRDQPTAGFIEPFIKRVESVIWNRCFFRVREHAAMGKRPFRGFAPDIAVTGDILCILFGCNVPCVLRPLTNQYIGDYYSMVGEAYVYGIMDGDYIESLGHDRCEGEATKFRIM